MNLPEELLGEIFSHLPSDRGLSFQTEQMDCKTQGLLLAAEFTRSCQSRPYLFNRTLPKSTEQKS